MLNLDILLVLKAGTRMLRVFQSKQGGALSLSSNIANNLVPGYGVQTENTGHTGVVNTNNQVFNTSIGVSFQLPTMKNPFTVGIPALCAMLTACLASSILNDFEIESKTF